MAHLKLSLQLVLIGLLTNTLWKDVVNGAPPIETAAPPAERVAPPVESVAPSIATSTPPVEKIAPSPSPPQLQPSRPSRSPLNSDIFAKALPAIVRVQAGQEMGSGTIISPDGLVLTNSHVVGRSRAVEVQVQGQAVYGTVIKVAGGVQATVDYALIKLQSGQYPYLERCPKSPTDGERIFIAGFPLGTYEPIRRTGRVLSQFGSPKANQFVIEADIKPGNSGGPLLNSNAQLCGVVTGNLGSRGIAGVQRAESVNQFLNESTTEF
jgi:S1-C subfamily serine protease